MPPPTPRRASARDLLSAVDVVVPARRPSGRYRLAIAAAVVALALIPLCYLALVAFLTWLLGWHIYQTLITLHLGPYAIFHVPMALLAGLLLLFLIKPIFFRRRGRDGQVLTLSPEREPLLFEFVHRVCQAVGATPPMAIEVDCQVNAHARLSGGIASLTRGSRVLRLGLPLVGGLPVNQFAGLLAHEFGHFNQRSGMHGTYAINWLNAFFAQVVFGRDRLDAQLMRLGRSRRLRSRLVHRVLSAPIESMRGVLWLMLVSGDLLTCSVQRQKEYDADVLAAHLTGARDFDRMGQTTMLLAVASHLANLDLNDAWHRMRLADNLPRLIIANAAQLREHRQKILEALQQQKTRWFDTHPCHADRVAYVQRHAPAALVQCSEPSKVLFSDFASLCESATRCLYEETFGEKLATAKFAPTAAIVAERAQQRESRLALRRFLQGNVARSRPIFPDAAAVDPPKDLHGTIAAVRQARQEMVSSGDLLLGAPARCDSATARIGVAGAKKSLYELFRRSPRVYSLKVKAIAEINQQEAVRLDAVQRLVPFEKAATRRLTAALQLLQSPQVAARLTPCPGADSATAQPEFARLLVGVCTSVQLFYADVAQLREMAAALQMGLAAINPRQPYAPLVQFANAAASRIVQLLKRMNGSLGTIPYPFAHGSDIGAVSDVVIQQIPNPQQLSEVLTAALNTASRFENLVFRMLAALCEWAERAEAAVGLQPLPLPVEQADDAELEVAAVSQPTRTRAYWRGYGVRAASGVVMIGALVGLSIHPPTLPAMGNGTGTEYKPAAFRVAVAAPAQSPEIRLPNRSWITVGPSNIQLPAPPNIAPLAPPAFRPGGRPAPINIGVKPPNMPQWMWEEYQQNAAVAQKYNHPMMPRLPSGGPYGASGPPHH